MASYRTMIDWEPLKPCILREMTEGKTQKDVRRGLAEDADDAARVSLRQTANMPVACSSLAVQACSLCRA